MPGIRERRPSATAMDSGKATASPIVDSMIVSGKPPQRAVSTSDKPSTPPIISVKNAANTPAQAMISQRRQNAR